MSDSDLYFLTRFSVLDRDQSLDMMREPEDFLQWFHGDILAVDARDHEYRLGTIHGVLVELGRAMDANVPAFDVADAHGMVEAYLGQFLVQSEDDSEIFEMGFCDVLIVDSIALRPEARGHGIGKAAMAATLENFNRYGLATIIRPWPLQFEKTTTQHFSRDFSRSLSTVSVEEREEFGSVSLRGLDQDDLDSSLRKVRETWEELGFREIELEGTENVRGYSAHKPLRFDFDAAQEKMRGLTRAKLGGLELVPDTGEDPES